MRLLLLIALVTVQALCSAGVYKWTDEQGKVHYGDQPAVGAEKVQLRTTIVSDTQAQPKTNSSSQAAPVEGGPYSLTITSPMPNESVRTPDGIVNITLRVEPTISPDLKIEFRLFLDGKPVEGSSGYLTNLRLSGVPKGMHRVSAQMVDDKGNVLATSQEVSFVVRQPGMTKEDGSSVKPTDSYNPDYTSKNNSTSTTYAPKEVDYSGSTKSNTSTYKPNSYPSYSPSSKATSTTYKPSYGSGGFKAK